MNIINKRFINFLTKSYKSEYVRFFSNETNINSKNLPIEKNSNSSLKPAADKSNFDNITHTGQVSNLIFKILVLV